MSVTYRIEYDDSAVQAVLNRLIATGQSPRDVMQEIAAYGENSTQRRFADGQAPDGTSWKPSWRAMDKGGKTLIDSSRLLGSITGDSGDDFAEWGSNVIYAAIHQFGGEIRPKSKKALFFRTPSGGGRSMKKVTIPARPYLGINQKDEENIIDIVNRHLAEAVAI
ncbi:phage virion morphogenesis protein [Nitrosomonas oligotropha]|uniref:phage virion morphogenesis protein n=1 Tax=Nitrosomonas oligotropha TaxID=42354 RepID=UPI00136F9305|nr:phage virion morphogenesis protein [Nitrosomonas oligotropha]MXS82271.1 phage virion morphogenesis protein [Nitrosomonas oligotropha]